MKAKIILVLILSLVVSCKAKTNQEIAKPIEKPVLHGYVLTLLGDAKIEGRSVSGYGDWIKEGEKLRVGLRSFVDLEFQYSGLNLCLRLEPGSVFVFNQFSPNEKKLSLELELGTGIFQAGENKDFQVEVATPLALIESGQSAFRLDVALDGLSRTIVTEGEVKIRPLVPVLDRKDTGNLPPIYAGLRKNLEKRVLSLPSGMKSEIDIEKAKSFSESLPIKEINSLLNSEENLGANIELIKKSMEDLPLPELEFKKAEAAVLQDIESHLVELKPISLQPTELKLAIRNRNQENKDLLLQRFETYSQSKLQTVHIRSGGDVTGIPIEKPSEEKGPLKFLTLEGEVLVEPEEIIEPEEAAQ